ncbi:hypothetical protein SAMN04489761_4022 [Tenacibaculum sp. MAR_2009_124]|uniref:hypothetical protein n=1 Tax=Tenacibaculum sp. MAR_2009_124 TaxID=1250059 RepID=UPI00089C2C8F|nr:hypothetical protein [Tenacibaculum sp. MAR_2009_124]SEC93770.1 hypothetical protein SAMN04489761_4022 [Tenacibaculum sp. MAR_2009_124]
MKITTLKNLLKLVLIVGVISHSSHTYGQEDKQVKKEVTSEPVYEGLQLKLNKNWKIKFSGQVNAYYVITNQKEDIDNGVEEETFHSLRNGISQATLSFMPQYTFDDGTTVVSTFGLAFGLSNSGVDASLPQSRGFGFAPVEIRQASIRINTPKHGSFLIGRDFGIFGLDAIYYDLSIFGVGANYSFATPKNTTLAGVGYGYIFVDKISQLNYTTPSFFGNTSNLTLGMYDPFASFDIYGAFGTPFGFTNNPNNVGVHGKYTFNKDFKNTNVYFSSAFISQDIGDNGTDSELSGFGVDTFLKIKTGGLTLSGYYYYANGIGDAGLMFGPAIQVGTGLETVKTQGYYAQATYGFKNSPITLGVNYGASKVKDQIVGNNLEYSESADRLTNSFSYAFNSNLILKSEFTLQGRHKVFAPEANVFSMGAIFLF